MDAISNNFFTCPAQKSEGKCTDRFQVVQDLHGSFSALFPSLGHGILGPAQPPVVKQLDQESKSNGITIATRRIGITTEPNTDMSSFSTKRIRKNDDMHVVFINGCFRGDEESHRLGRELAHFRRVNFREVMPSGQVTSLSNNE